MSTKVLTSFRMKSLCIGFLSKKYTRTLFESCCTCRLTNQLNKPYQHHYLYPSATSNNRPNSTLSTENVNGTQIYHGILTPQIKAVKLFSLLTSMAGVVAQPILFYHGSDVGSIPVLMAVGTFVGFFTFVTPFLLHVITKKYVTEVHYNASSAQYTATIYNFFLQRKKILFQPKDVVVPEIPGMFTSFIAKGVPLFVEARLFEEPQHYAKIMGYDKPIDFKLQNITPRTKEEAKK